MFDWGRLDGRNRGTRIGRIPRIAVDKKRVGRGTDGWRVSEEVGKDRRRLKGCDSLMLLSRPVLLEIDADLDGEGGIDPFRVGRSHMILEDIEVGIVEPAVWAVVDRHGSCLP